MLNVSLSLVSRCACVRVCVLVSVNVSVGVCMCRVVEGWGNVGDVLCGLHVDNMGWGRMF